jgi:hypothetical protein
MKESHPEIEMGTHICKRLHKIYVTSQRWDGKISNHVAKIFSKLKLKMGYFYSGLNLSRIELLQKINQSNDEDFKEMCDAYLSKEDIYTE